MRRSDRGFATAEMAAALPVLVVLLVVALSAVGAVTSQLRCIDAAREGARAAARGEPTGRVVAVTEHVAPPGAGVTVLMSHASAGEVVTVTVVHQVRMLGRLLPSMAVSGLAVALVEPAGP